MSQIVSIVYKPANVEQKPADYYARVSLPRAQLVAGHGIEGDRKGGTKDRHLNIMLAEMLSQLHADGFRTGPGELGEQIVLSGLQPEMLSAGVRLRLGDTAIVEIVEPRTGCARFVHIQKKTKESARGKIGYMARVVEGGWIAENDEVRLEPEAP
ncbi:MAG TPA: MOSC domain-containing protein [Gemmataceae bacterium]|nr:MOSC domain-containing protein [Gemmataceae bacterium]